MKKRLTAMMLALVMTCSAVGCGNKQTTDNTSEKITEGQEEQEDQEKPDTKAKDDKKKEKPDQNKPEKEVIEDASDKVPQLILFHKNTYEFSDDDTYTELVNGKFAMPLLSDESAREFPMLAAALESNCKSETAVYDSEIASSVKEAKDWYSENSEFFFGPWETTQDVSVKRCDDKVVSFFFPVYQFAGGAHGIYGNGYVTYDTETGKVLRLSDVLTSTDNLTSILKDKLLKQYSEDPDMFFDLDNSLSLYVDGDSYSEGEGENEKFYTGYTWALTSEGIEFYFGPYELAAYAYGAQDVVLRYDEYPDMFVKDYLPDSGERNYMEKLGSYTDYIDLTGDGAADIIQIDYQYNDDYSEKTGADFVVNDKRVTLGGEYGLVDLDSEIQCYYIHMTSGKDYVYLVASDFNDFFRYMIYDVTGGDIKEVDDTDYSMAMLPAQDDDYLSYREYFLYDPDHMKLASRFDVICTFNAIRDYHVGDDGKPVSDDKEYTILNTAAYEPITSIKEFECDVVGEDGSLTKATISSGETFDLISTDGETYVDARVSDGRIVRLYYKNVGYELMVNDIPATDLFEELMYAG